MLVYQPIVATTVYFLSILELIALGESLPGIQGIDHTMCQPIIGRGALAVEESDLFFSAGAVDLEIVQIYRTHVGVAGQSAGTKQAGKHNADARDDAWPWTRCFHVVPG